MKKSANDHHTQNTPAEAFEPLIAKSLRRRWRAKSEFGQGLRAPLDRNARDLWMNRVEIHRRAKRLTASEALAAQAMASKQGTDGRLDPSHETIAKDAGVGERTVRRALVKLRDLGLLVWVRRLVRNGWRTEQTSNSYALSLGEVPALPRPRCGGQIGRETSKVILSKVPIEDQIAAFQLSVEEKAKLAQISKDRNALFQKNWLAGKRGDAAWASNEQ